MSYYGGNMTRRRLLVILLIGTALAYLWVGSHFITWSPEGARSQGKPETAVSGSATPGKSTQEKEEELEAAQRALWEAGTSYPQMVYAYARYADAQRALNPNWHESSPPLAQPKIDTTPSPSEEAVDDTPPLPQNEADEAAGQ